MFRKETDKYFLNIFEMITKSSEISAKVVGGLPSVCCEYVLLPLVEKEAALAYDSQNIARWEN